MILEFHNLVVESEETVAVGFGASLGGWSDGSGSLDLKRLKIAAARQVTQHVTVAKNDKPHATPIQFRGCSSDDFKTTAPKTETIQTMILALAAMPACQDKRLYLSAFDNAITVAAFNGQKEICR